MVGDLHAFERSLRTCFAAAGRLSASAAEAHADQQIGGLGGHQVFKSITLAQSGVADAISATAQAHRQAEAIGRAIGLDVTAWGDGPKPPEDQRFWTGARVAGDTVA